MKTRVWLPLQAPTAESTGVATSGCYITHSGNDIT